MTAWSKRPRIYEINTWVWLNELTKTAGASMTLADVPTTKWDAIAAYGFDAVWLMGVWERSPAGIDIAMRNEALLADFRRALPDFKAEDNVGSPYCVRRYQVDERLGGPKGLAAARKMLADRGMRLILDFVPNHVAPDHPWATEHPEYFIQGSAEDLAREPQSFLNMAGRVIACGRDPFFPAWPDVLQLNAFHSGLRTAAVETVTSIASQCDGMRCDMAMLMMNSVFERTWGTRADVKPATDYWPQIIAAVKSRSPDTLFMAEAYWDLEFELQQQGFDYCYDKRLYDRLEHESAESVRLHLCADPAYQDKLLRFLENHDEPRAAATFSSEKAKAAAVSVSTQRGAVLFHEGQFDGRRTRVPVFLRRRPQEDPDKELREFYKKLLDVLKDPVIQDGDWRLCERTGWPDNQSYLNLVAWCWSGRDGWYLIVVNLSETPSQGNIQVLAENLAGRKWRMTDRITGATYDRNGDDLYRPGLYVDLNPWAFHVLKF
ncbi:alpha-amylase [Nitrospira sp. KM1]|uniref:alpha-amylase family glycosyl hydrolase n=1 Tax=Nitrospira sp. KM1 TaxID=1936990 RepID=UPI0013A77813|nr:alpha-amylase family glycosyl hydrolase [Nitrospira sp. KM1]BCA53053.1 alpha-amylase [Nitrospira sp. KM1]